MPRKRKPARSPIPVEVLSEQEQGERARWERWERAGRRLIAYGQIDSIENTIRLAETYVSIHEHPEESDDVFHARQSSLGRRGAS